MESEGKRWKLENQNKLRNVNLVGVRQGGSPVFPALDRTQQGGYHKYKAIMYQKVSARTAWAGDRKVFLFKRLELELRSLHVRP